jgi:hypothetical protein
VLLWYDGCAARYTVWRRDLIAVIDGRTRATRCAAALGVERVVLTMIGGGVFANPMHVIWDAILWAADQVRPVLRRDLTAVVNGRSLGDALPPHQLRAAVQQRGGALIRLQRGERPVVAS